MPNAWAPAGPRWLSFSCHTISDQSRLRLRERAYLLLRSAKALLGARKKTFSLSGSPRRRTILRRPRALAMGGRAKLRCRQVGRYFGVQRRRRAQTRRDAGRQAPMG